MKLSRLFLFYLDFLISLSKKVKANGFLLLLFGVVTFLSNQLFLVAAFFLPLKVIIMISTEGIPRYLTLFVDSSNKQFFVSLLAFMAVTFYILYLVTDVSLNAISKIISNRISRRSNKITLFESESSFSKDVILRIVRTWGTFIMLFLGVVLGFTLEWKIFLAISISSFLQITLINIAWNRVQRPELLLSKQSFVKNKTNIFNGLSAINFFVGFSVLYYLYLTKELNSLLIGVLVLLLIRQLSQRAVVALNDAVFLSENRKKITALFFTHSYFERSKKNVEKVFESLMQPKLREGLFNSIKQDNPSLYDMCWIWFDFGEAGVSAFRSDSEGEDTSYWLFFYSANKKSSFETSRLVLSQYMQRRDKFVPEILNSGESFGVSYLFVRTCKYHEIDKSIRKKSVSKWLVNTWKAHPPTQVVNILERSLPSLGKRFSSDRISLLYIAAKDQKEIKNIDNFKSKEDFFKDYLSKIPTFVLNGNASIFNLIPNGATEFTYLMWSSVSIEPVFSDLNVNHLGKHVDASEIVVELSSSRSDCTSLTENDVYLVAYLSALDKYINKGLYRMALDTLSHILDIQDD